MTNPQPDFQVDLDDLTRAAGAWGNVAANLDTAATQAKSIHDGQGIDEVDKVQWAMFQQSWDAQVKAAQYVHDRLLEGSSAGRNMRDILNHIARMYKEHDERFAQAILHIASGLQ